MMKAFIQFLVLVGFLNTHLSAQFDESIPDGIVDLLENPYELLEFGGSTPLTIRNGYLVAGLLEASPGSHSYVRYVAPEDGFINLAWNVNPVSDLTVEISINPDSDQEILLSGSYGKSNPSDTPIQKNYRISSGDIFEIRFSAPDLGLFEAVANTVEFTRIQHYSDANLDVEFKSLADGSWDTDYLKIGNE